MRRRESRPKRVLTFCAGEDCQKQSGSAYSLVAVFHKSAVKISGPVKEYTSKGDSGKNVTRSFCSECGSPIAHDPEAAPEVRPR